MPAALIPAHGLKPWAAWTTDAHQWLALVGWTFDDTIQTLADVAAFEPTDGSYLRQGAAGEIESIVAGVGWRLTCNDVTFVGQSGGEAWSWAVVAQDNGGADSGDLILGVYRIARVTDGTDVLYHVPAITSGLAFFPIGAG